MGTNSDTCERIHLYLYAWHYIALSFAVFCCKALGCVASCCAMLCCVLSRCTVLRTLSVCLSGCQSTYLYICLSFNLPTSISAYLLQLGSHGCQQQRHRMQTSREGVVPSIATPLTDSPVCIQKYRHTHISTYVHGLQKATQHETE